MLHAGPCELAGDLPSDPLRHPLHKPGSQYTEKNVDTIHSTGNTNYTITGPYSGDEICLSVRAANKYGASAWAETWCTTVPY
ncbi:hypothetical protein OG512_04840 [Streptomyces sp. NBC_01378]|uniref:hypothetical protein n=1 Tax=Streptomyces sp. NBC_01378 TaxID=2903844 RepID=UPI0032551257